MKKVYPRNFSATHSKKIWAPIAFLMSTIYFGGLLANWNRNKDIHMGDELFVPSITIVKTGIPLSLSGGPGCSVIEYTFTVTNTSTNGEILGGIEVTDPLFVDPIPGPIPESDIGNDSEMDPGEVWTYTASYTILEADIINGQISNQANVTANVQGQPGVEVDDVSDDGTPMDGEETVIDLTACQPGISLIKVGAAIQDIDAGPGCNYILYTFSVANEGEQILNNVVFDDPLLDDAMVMINFIEDTNGNNDAFLDPNEIWTYAALYNITADDINNGQVVNQAEVTADVQNFPGITVSDLSDNDSPTENQPTVIDLTFCQGGISLIKVGAAIEDIDAGPGCNYILYTFSVANEGVQILEGVVLDDPLLDNAMVVITFNEGDDNNNTFLDPGEIWTYSAVYNITADDITNGLVENQATVTADVQGLPNISVSDDSDYDSPTENRPTVVDLTPCQAGIYVIKTGQALSISGGPGCDVIQYTFEVVNSSWIYTLDQVALSDPLISNINLPGPDFESINNNGVLDPEETWIYTAQYTIDPADIINGQVVNQASVIAQVQGQPGIFVTDDSDNDSPTENESTVVDLSDCQGNISMIITPIVDCDVIELHYGIINNSIYGQVLENIVITDPLFGDPIPGPSPGQDIGDDGLMHPGETWYYVADYDVQQTDIENGQIIIQATVTANVQGMPGVIVSDLSDNDSPHEDDPIIADLVHCQDPALGLIKEGVVMDLNGDGCPESILYTFTLKNTSGVDLDEVTLEDALLGGQVLGPVIGTDVNNDGILSFGETWTYEAVYAIVQDDIDNGFLLNQATVTANTVVGDTPVFDLSDNNDFFEDEMTTTSVPNDACTDGGASLGLIKQGVLVDTNADDCLDTVRYTFTVTSSGGVAFDSIVLIDPLLGGQVAGPVVGSDQNNDGILSPGETWTFEADYYLAQGDIDTGNVMNQAIVAGEPVGFDFQLMDLSDNDSYAENEMTETIVPSNACIDGGTPIGFEIFNGITPNGDGSNDYFRVLGIENYPDNQLKIYNRWGVLVYESENYGQGNNLFFGISDGRATFQKDKQLPSGTYFYILTFTGTNPGKDSYSGYLYINRD